MRDIRVAQLRHGEFGLWAGMASMISLRLLYALFGRHVAGGDFVLVGGEGREHFVFLTLRDLEEIEGPSEFRRDLIEFCGEMRRSRWASSSPSGAEPGLVAVNWKGPPET